MTSKKQSGNDESNLISLSTLRAYNVQYGQKLKKKNPKMDSFITQRKGKDYNEIELTKTIPYLMNAFNKIQLSAQMGEVILFVGTRKQFSKSIEENAKRVNCFYISHRWLGGLLTNWRTIQKSIERYSKLENLNETGFNGYTKKEAIFLKKDLKKLERNFSGIRYMNKKPDLIVIASTSSEKITIDEARKFKIPIVGLVNSNSDPTLVDFPIPANDVVNKSASLLITILADAVAKVNNREMYCAYKNSLKDLKILGLEEKDNQDIDKLIDKKGRTNYRRKMNSAKIESSKENN